MATFREQPVRLSGCPVTADLNRYLAEQDREQVWTDAVADRLAQISADADYTNYAWDMPEPLLNRLNVMVLDAIRNDSELWAAFLKVLEPVAEIELMREMEAAGEPH